MQIFNKNETQAINLQLGSSVVFSKEGVAAIHITTEDYSDALDTMIDAGEIGFFSFGGDELYTVTNYVLSEFKDGPGFILTLDISL